MSGPEILLTKNVFVAGRQPSVTYNPRDDWRLEAELNGYLDQGPGKALAIAGPTKSGKTVLVERRLPVDEAIWMQGSDLLSVDDFWSTIIDWLGLYDQVETTTQSGTDSGRNRSASLGVPRAANVNWGSSDSASETSSQRASRQLAAATVARNGLTELEGEVPIVIDDFHYVEDSAKQAIARAIKSVIPTTNVVLIAVPHEAFHAVRSEPDMGGRVSQLHIELWSIDELEYIAREGFKALGVTDGAEIGRKLAESSYGAPFLMQELCYDYATGNGILKTEEPTIPAPPLESWEVFFERAANRNAPMIFEPLKTGPKMRGQQRIDRVLKDGRKTDIYGALLYAIYKTGPVATIPYQDISKVMEQEFRESVSSQQITASLSHMSTIAKENRGTGDQALAYSDDRLHILDPFLLFFLRHGTWDVTK